MIRVGFLLNHDAAHQVMHSAPIAFELARRCPGIHVVVISTTRAEAEAVERIAENFPGVECSYEMAAPPSYAGGFDRFTGHALLAKRFGVLWHRRKLFRSLDALVVPDKTSLVLKRWLGAECPLLINTFHGAGDRSGGYKGVAGFDYHLLPGSKYLRRMIEEGMTDRKCCAVIGYVKFDHMNKAAPPALFADDRPTVLYAPHFDPKFSSWYGWGAPILDYFANNPDFNLIFAPHVLLYRRRWHISTEGGLPKRTPDIPLVARQAPNILVDPGSIASIDMTYTRAADIYLGDVSSLVYEFLIEPRPCIFLNRSRASWRDNANFRFWRAGEVLESLDELPGALARAHMEPQRHFEEQRQAFAEAFDLTETPSTVRAADAIARFLYSSGKLPAVTALGTTAPASSEGV